MNRKKRKGQVALTATVVSTRAETADSGCVLLLFVSLQRAHMLYLYAFFRAKDFEFPNDACYVLVQFKQLLNKRTHARAAGQDKLLVSTLKREKAKRL